MYLRRATVFHQRQNRRRGRPCCGGVVKAKVKRMRNLKKRGKLSGAAKAAFLARMAKGRKKAGKAPRKSRRKNPAPARSTRPVLYKICIKGKGPLMHYDGEKFSERA